MKKEQQNSTPFDGDTASLFPFKMFVNDFYSILFGIHALVGKICTEAGTPKEESQIVMSFESETAEVTIYGLATDEDALKKLTGSLSVEYKVLNYKEYVDTIIARGQEREDHKKTIREKRRRDAENIFRSAESTEQPEPKEDTEPNKGLFGEKSVFRKTKENKRISMSAYNKLIDDIENWVDRTPFNAFRKAIKKRVRGQPMLDRLLMNVYNYLKCLVSENKHFNNMLLAAPSGCGKTETYRALKDYFSTQIPNLIISQVDMTSFTEEGFKGKNTVDVVFDLNKDQKGIGLIFMDEFDKKMYPSYSSSGQNVNFAVQAQLLTLIEGKILDYKDKEGIDTSKTLFIGMGAFDMIREKKKNPEKHVGFGAINSEGVDHYCDITREDMLELGGACELLGRFPTIINYHKLSKEIVDELIDRFLGEEIENTGCLIEISDNMRQELHKSANGKYGCRALKAIIHSAALEGAILACDDDIELNRCYIHVDSPDEIEYRLFDEKIRSTPIDEIA